MAPVNPGSFEHVRKQPEAAARWLTAEAGLWATTVTVVAHAANLTIFEATFEPPPDLEDYPVEQVRITVRANGQVIAVPVGPPRTWKHIYPQALLETVTATERVGWLSLLGGLCLEYPGDPDHLRWIWDDGLDGYLQIVQRHLWFEEHHRRGSPWPAEDVPHGGPRYLLDHPILTPDLRSPT